MRENNVLLLVQLFWKPLQAEYPKCGVTITLVGRTVSTLPPVLLGSSRGALIPADNRESRRAQFLNGQLWAAPAKAEGSPSPDLGTAGVRYSRKPLLPYAT